LIYVRSRRPLLTVGACALASAAVFGILGWIAWDLPASIAAMALWGACGAALVAAAWAAIALRAWPTGKLAFFRDRLVVVQRRHEMCALWEQIEAITLADVATWPEMKLTDRLTVTCRWSAPMRFKPADFGLDSAGCRDLLVRLRDERELRERLPEFDSEKDLEATPLVAGEAAEPRF
jgi:hypothetical protein